MGLSVSELYKINYTMVHEVDAVDLVQLWERDGVLELQHHRLGHLNVKSVRALQSIVNGINPGKILCPTSLLICEECIEYKQHMPIYLMIELLEIVHSSMYGPCKILC